MGATHRVSDRSVSSSEGPCSDTYSLESCGESYSEQQRRKQRSRPPSVAPNPLKANTASTDHHLYVLEAAGLLIGFEEITTPEVRGHYTACRARAF